MAVHHLSCPDLGGLSNTAAGGGEFVKFVPLLGIYWDGLNRNQLLIEAFSCSVTVRKRFYY